MYERVYVVRQIVGWGGQHISGSHQRTMKLCCFMSVFTHSQIHLGLGQANLGLQRGYPAPPIYIYIYICIYIYIQYSIFSTLNY
ncbi:hypothetical protein MOSE0_N04082 [Monosporozyma servazzii]